MLSNRETKLVRLLLDANGPLTSKELAAQLGLSARTVKTYVQQINATLPNCISAGQKGYTCNPSAVGSTIVNHPDDAIPQTSEDRCTFVLKKLLSTNDCLNIFDLCEELFVSYSTLKSDLKKIRGSIIGHNINIVQDNNRITITGREKDKRRYANELLHREASNAFLNIDAVQQSFPSIDISFIKDAIEQVLIEYRSFANDYSVINLVLHTAITIDRVRNGHEVDDQHQSVSSIPHYQDVPLGIREEKMSRAIADTLGKRFDVSFSAAEQYELGFLLASRTTLLDYRTASRDVVKRFVGNKCLGIVDAIIDDLRGYYGIDLSEHEFYVRFALHIKNLLLRAEHGELTTNPLTQQIRSTCPLLYDTAVAEADLLNRMANVHINEDEIAYIAFHLGSALETQKQLTNKVKAVLYCPSYYDIDSKLVLFLERHFETNLLITNVVTDEADLAHLRGLELLIATVPINGFLEVPVYQISLFPSESDVSHIRVLVDQIQHEKRRCAMWLNLERLINADFFEVNTRLVERDDVIHTMSNKLIEHDYVQDDFEERVTERERLSSTAYNSVAIPHAIRLEARRSNISVMVSKTPIRWGETHVNLVLLLSFSRTDRNIFYEVFDPLIAILSNPSQVDRLTGITDYETFIQCLCDMME